MEVDLINTLSKFIKEFQSRNYIFLCESDIKCRLYNLLYDKYNKATLRLCEYLKLENQDIQCPIITSEYAYFSKDEPNKRFFRSTSKKMDLAILDVHSISKVESIIEQYNVEEENYSGFLPVKYGIELNYCRTDNILEDSSKLREYNYVNNDSFQGIVIQFHRKSNSIAKDVKYFKEGYKNEFIRITDIAEIFKENPKFRVVIIAVFPEEIFYKLEGCKIL